MNRLRLLLGLLFAIAWAVGAFADLREGVPRAWLAWIASGLGAAVSAAFLRHYRHAWASVRSLLLSVLVDSVTAGLAVVPLVLSPGPHFNGAARMPGTYLLLYVMIAAGLRLSRRAMWLGVGLNGLSAVAIVLFDAWRAPHRPSLALDLLVFGVLLIASAIMSFWVCERTRRLVLEGATSAVRAERTRMLLGAYADDEVAEHALAASRLSLGGEQREVAVLFTDLRGFTTYAEKLAPQDLVQQINDYMGDMVAVIKREGGVVDKFIGDAIMAVFGAPVSRGDDAGRAIRAARGMMEALSAHNARRAARGLPPLAHGIGVHFGVVVAGNLGTEGRANYTVVGDTVNLASRLESMNKELGTSVLISEAAARAAPDEARQLREVTTVQVRGRAEPVRVLTLPEPSAS